MGSLGQGLGGGIGAVVGGVIGWFVGGGPYGAAQGAYIGGSLGMMVGSAIDPPRPSYGISQYKKQDIYYNTMTHNLPVPIVYGINRVAGNVIWLGNLSVEVRGGEGGKTGGSGGGGKKGGTDQQEVVVHGDFAVALSEGEILEVRDVFIGDKVITELEGLNYTAYLGTGSQTADPRLVTDLGTLAPAFRYTAYLAMGGELGSQPQLPVVNAEVAGRFATTVPGSGYTWGDPAQAVEDVLTHTRYGVGLDVGRPDPITFAAVRSFCAEAIPVASGTEPRFCLDYVVDEYRPTVEHLRDMLASFRGYLTWSQGVIKLWVDRPGSVVQSFGMAEIVTDSFHWKKQSYRERPNVVRVEYVEPGALVQGGTDPSVAALLADSAVSQSQLSFKSEYKTYRQDFVEASDPWDIARTGERRERVFNLTAIKRRTQAQRMAYYYLNKAVHCQHACAFRVGINALEAEVGDVVAVSHDVPKWAGKLFRIVEVEETENDELTLGCLEYSSAIYNDSLAIAAHGQDTIYGGGSATGGVPYNVGRLSVYERPAENTVEVAYTRIATSDMFGGVDLYIKRGAADYTFVDGFVLASAPTAYLAPTVNTLSLVTSGTGTGVLTIQGVPGGYSARLFMPNNSYQAEAVASMGTIELTPALTTPGSGYLQLYTNGLSYSVVAPLGRYPASGNGTYRAGDLYEYARVPQLVTATQSWMYIERPAGGWTNTDSLRVELEEMGYITFTDSMLTGLSRGAHGTTATSHTGVISLGMAALNSGGTGGLLNLTAAFTQIGSAAAFFTQNSQQLYVGASSKFSAVNLWLARKASDKLGLYGEYSTGQGTWASLMSSGYLPATDSTSGLTWDGQVAYEPPSNWAVNHLISSGGANIVDTTDRYYLRLTRVASLCDTPPAELEVTLTNDTLAAVRDSSAYLYALTLADSGQQLSFKAISRSLGGAMGDGATSPVATYLNA